MGKPKFKITGTIFQAEKKGDENNGSSESEMVLVRVECLGKVLRFCHYIIDLAIFFVLNSIIEIVVFLIPGISKSFLQLDITIQGYISAIFGLSLLFIYYTFFEYIFQRTPGKFLTRSIVINEYGNKPTLKNIAIRSISRLMPFEQMTCLSAKNRGWHDVWSNTFLISNKELRRIQNLAKTDHS